MPPRSRTASRQTDSLGGDQAPQPSPTSGNTIRGRGRGRGERRGRGRGRGRGSGRSGVDFHGSTPARDRDQLIIDSLANITVLLTNIVNSQRQPEAPGGVSPDTRVGGGTRDGTEDGTRGGTSDGAVAGGAAGVAVGTGDAGETRG
ncbi:uncharacterized protein LOC127812710 [Diospyros lotus]|uniref:uncharacterized protein LOC127812710 n=1 Tax=Diospyros lotus TaxID=55363 RepID=UPI002257914A|nr:uncharacterized protein LOC127812710 [Diospyros lotus]